MTCLNDTNKVCENFGNLEIVPNEALTEEKEFLEHGPIENDELSPLSKSVSICEENVNPPGEKVTANDFEILKKIGKGGYGQVYLTQKINGAMCGEVFAMKVVKKARLITNKPEDARYAMTERSILESCNHPFLVKLFFAFQTSHNLFMVLEYLAGGELFAHLERENNLSENEARFYLAEITLALGHLHSIGIIYRDLKTENVMLDKDGHVKLTDFGLSKERVEDNLTHSYCGTIEYMAPEILERRGHTFSVDWWSMGVLFYDMIVGSSPFVHKDKKVVFQRVIKGIVKYPKYISEAGKHLIKNLILKDPVKRLGGGPNDAKDIQKHFFFRLIDWNKVLRKQMTPPFIPKLSGKDDVSLFDANVLNEPCVISPTGSSHLGATANIPSTPNGASAANCNWFENFSFVSPQVYLYNSSAEGSNGSASRQRSRSGVSHSSSSPHDLHHEPATQFLFEEDFEDVK